MIKTNNNKVAYLTNLNNFRGVAIIFIVFGHCFKLGMLNYIDNNSILAEFLRILLPGGTTFFVFISGYLLHHIHNKNFNIKLFLTKKIKYIILPFLIFASLDYLFYFIVYIINLLKSPDHCKFYLNLIESTKLKNIYLLGHTSLNIGLWFIPFIFIIFCLSSVYLKFKDLSLKLQKSIIFFFISLSILLHRSQNDQLIGLFQNVIYFTPSYLLGILYSINSQKIYNYFRNKIWIFTSLTLIISILQVKIGKVQPFNKVNTINYYNFDLMIVQKNLLSILLVNIFERFSKKESKILNIIALNSFGIFFIHGLLIWLINSISEIYKIKQTSSSTLLFLIGASIVFITSLLISNFIRKILPNYSKFIIGC